jgi:endonuclease/exonuclease/phosphatase (EEP) superfamily protein YafD
LNISPSHPVIKSLSERLVNADEYLEEFDRTYIGALCDPAFKWKIDHIFVKGLKIGYEKIEMDTPSDHRPIYISVDFE